MVSTVNRALRFYIWAKFDKFSKLIFYTNFVTMTRLANQIALDDAIHDVQRI